MSIGFFLNSALSQFLFPGSYVFKKKKMMMMIMLLLLLLLLNTSLGKLAKTKWFAETEWTLKIKGVGRNLLWQLVNCFIGKKKKITWFNFCLFHSCKKGKLASFSILEFVLHLTISISLTNLLNSNDFFCIMPLKCKSYSC